MEGTFAVERRTRMDCVVNAVTLRAANRALSTSRGGAAFASRELPQHGPVPVKRTRGSRSPACQKQLQLRERDLAPLMQSQIRRFPSAEPALGARAGLATAAACSLTSTLRSGIKKSTRTIGWTTSSRCHMRSSGFRSSCKRPPAFLAWPRWYSASCRPRRVPASASRTRVEQCSGSVKRWALGAH